MRNFICLTCLMMLGFIANGYTQTQDIDAIREERKIVLEQIKKTNDALASNSKSVKVQLYQYTLLSNQVSESEKYLSLLNREYLQTGRKIHALELKYAELKKQLEQKKQDYALSVRQLYTHMNADTKLMFLFSAENLQQSMRRMRYLNEYSRYQRRQAEEIKEQQKSLESTRIELEQTHQKQADLLAEQKEEQSRLKQERTKQDTLLKQLRKQESSLKTELKKQQQKAESLNRQIEKIIAEEQQKAAADKSRTQESQGGYAMTVDEKKLATEFGKNQGKLPFPVSEPGTIMVHFGEQKHQDMQYVSTKSNGIEIQTTAGASAKAIFNGSVSKIFSVPGSNFSIIIRHGNYLSVYSNLENVNVKSGEKIKIGQSLGKIYVDKEQGNLTIMHFQIWKDMQRMNPELWIKRR